ncbi:MAG: T9SS type A sorting domain-containing protein, partial [Chlorobi bacterium]|nr:T9SS type A sorting domain-containing protein [Chlorobiota bacterium]
IGDEIPVMLTSSDLSGLGVVSFEFTVTYDASVVTATGINTSETISGASGWNIQVNTDTPGEISVASLGASELTGSGDFIELVFEVASEPGYTDLSSTNFTFNSGIPSANVTNGSITINACPEVAIEIPDIDATSLNTGEEIHVMIASSDITDLGVVSFEFTLTYNPELLTAVGINTDGTISGADGWTATANTETPGIINVGGSGSGELTGSGDFIEIIFTKDYDYGESDLISTSWLFNDGCPTANVTNGAILLPVELTSFTGTTKENNITLQWATATEVNNKGFELFRNGEEITFINGYGTSADERVYSFIDKNLSQGKYNYQLVQVDFDGSNRQVGEIEVIMNNIPKKYSLKQNYPNPFSKGSGGNTSTKIEYSLPEESFVNITIYDMLGKKIAQLVSEKKAAGNYVIDFNAGNLSNGIYLYKMTSNNFTLVKKMILLK